MKRREGGEGGNVGGFEWTGRLSGGDHSRPGQGMDGWDQGKGEGLFASGQWWSCWGWGCQSFLFLLILLFICLFVCLFVCVSSVLLDYSVVIPCFLNRLYILDSIPDTRRVFI